MWLVGLRDWVLQSYESQMNDPQTMVVIVELDEEVANQYT